MSDDEEYYRADWMTDDQWQCFLFFADLRGGFHHIGAEPKKCGKGIEINCPYGCWSTWDFNDLTRAVVMSHDRMVRFEILPGGPGRLKFNLHKRHNRSGQMYERLPELEEHIAAIRQRRPVSQPS